MSDIPLRIKRAVVEILERSFFVDDADEVEASEQKVLSLLRPSPQKGRSRQRF